MLRSHGANSHERTEPSSNRLCSSGLRTHVKVVSQCLPLQCIRLRKAPHMLHPKAKGAIQALHNVVVEERTARARRDFTNGIKNGVVSLTRKPLDPQDRVED